VSKESATLGLALHRETCLPIDADHSMMCKFNFHDRAFEPVVDNMKDLIAYSVAAHQSVDVISTIPSVASSEIGTNHIHETAETMLNNTTSDCLRSLAPVDQQRLLWNALRTPAELCPYQWFFETKEYVEWTESEKNNVLWILAGPGCGKTTLVANVLKRVNGYLGSTQTTGCIEALTLFYFFDNSNRQTESTAFSCIQTIITQLIEQAPCLLPLIVKAYSSLSEKPTFTWTWDTLWSVFLNMLQELSKLGCRSVKLIIDAIDECDGESQTVLLESLQYLLDASGHVPFCSILISSRINFQRNLSPATLFDMNPDSTASDMEAFIRSAVGDFVHARRLSPLVGDKIGYFLEQKANGMFLWVRLVLEELHRRDVPLTEDVIEGKLQLVPLRISSIYAEIMRDIQTINRDDVWGILRWLIFARRTMTVDDLEAALCIEYNLPHWYDLAGDLQFICGPLIRIDNEEVKFVHETVKDYLTAEFENWRQSISAEEQNPHERLAETCLRFIARADLLSYSYRSPMIPVQSGLSPTSDRTDPGLAQSSLTLFLDRTGPKPILNWDRPDWWNCCESPKEPFLAYSTTTLGYHLAAVSQPSPRLLHLALDFFNDQRHIDFILGWYWRLVNGNPRVSPRGAKLLNIAGYFNILWLIDLALVLGDAIDEGSPLGKKASPLIWASEMGNLDAIVKLLDAGANPNHRETDNWTALHWAAANGHHAVAHALMQAGADREWKDSNGLSPVDWAKRMGYPELASAIEHFGVLMTLVAPQNQIYPPEIDTAMIPKCSVERQSALPCFRDYIKSTLENSDKT